MNSTLKAAWNVVFLLVVVAGMAVLAIWGFKKVLHDAYAAVPSFDGAAVAAAGGIAAGAELVQHAELENVVQPLYVDPTDVVMSEVAGLEAFAS
jgi:hypothetical protein